MPATRIALIETAAVLVDCWPARYALGMASLVSGREYSVYHDAVPRPPGARGNTFYVEPRSDAIKA
jgi:hypothetical protein